MKMEDFQRAELDGTQYIFQKGKLKDNEDGRHNCDDCGNPITGTLWNQISEDDYYPLRGSTEKRLLCQNCVTNYLTAEKL